jgi:uncharacterized protein
VKVVVDTSVLVSAAMCDRVPEAVLHAVIASNAWEWVASAAVIAEYEDVLHRPKLGITRVAEWLQVVDRNVTVVDVQHEVEFLPDPADAKLLSCAVAAAADYLVTGDHALLELGQCGCTAIVTVADLATRLGLAR